MLQRSPTYVVSRPARGSRSPTGCARRLPAKLAYHLIRWRNVLLGMYFFQLARQASREQVKQVIIGGVRKAARPRLRRRHAFHAALQSVGPAPVPGAGRRPVQGDPARHAPRSSPTRSTRFTAERHPAEVRQRAGGRHHRHRDRAQAAVARRPGGHASTARAVDFAQDLDLQGHDVCRRAEPRRPRSATPTRPGR